MSRTNKLIALVAAYVFAAPQPALAATQVVVVPEGLALGAGLVGLATAIVLMVDAVALRRVSDGSMIADNIAYMMLAVLCFAASMLARFMANVEQFAQVLDLVALAADLLMTLGMALLAVYFFRVRTAMTRYLRSAQAYQESAAKDEGEAGA